jgi:hypothetical protein
MGKSFHDQVITIRLPAPPLDVDLTNDGTRVAVALAAAPGIPSLCVYDTAAGDQVTSVAEGASFGRGVAFGRGGRCLYGLVEDASARTIELRRYPLEGGESALLSAYPYGEAYALERNLAADLLVVLGRDVQVLHDEGRVSNPEVVRIITGIDRAHTVHAQLPAQGAYAYCSGVAEGHVVRWDLKRNCEDGRWPVPSTYGRIALSHSGRHCIVVNHGIRGVFFIDTANDQRFMPELFNERHLTGSFEFVPDETGFVFPAGAHAGFFPLRTGEMIEGPMLYDGSNVGVYGAWEADAYAFAYDESYLCLARMS